jgi:hypothetical protein
MSVSAITLSTLCFPDITGATIKAWGTVSFTSGSYNAGGLVMGLVNYADARTVDFNGFLQCNMVDETAAAAGVGTYSLRYVPSGDLLQIIDNTTGKEIANGVSIPANLLTDSIIFEATWNRTTTLG